LAKGSKNHEGAKNNERINFIFLKIGFVFAFLVGEIGF